MTDGLTGFEFLNRMYVSVSKNMIMVAAVAETMRRLTLAGQVLKGNFFFMVSFILKWLFLMTHVKSMKDQ